MVMSNFYSIKSKVTEKLGNEVYIYEFPNLTYAEFFKTLQDKAVTYKYNNGENNCSIYDYCYDQDNNSLNIMFGCGSNGFEGSVINTLGYLQDFLQFIQDNELVSECYIVEAFFDNLDDVYDFHITIRFVDSETNN